MKFDELTKTWQYKTASSITVVLHNLLLVLKAMGSDISWWLVFAPLIAISITSFILGFMSETYSSEDRDDPYKGD